MGYSQGTPNKITPSPPLSTAEAALRSPFCRLSRKDSGWLSFTGSPKIISSPPSGEYRAAHRKCLARAPYSISSLVPWAEAPSPAAMWAMDSAMVSRSSMIVSKCRDTCSFIPAM